MTQVMSPNISVYENDFQLKLQGRKGILHPSEDLIRLIARGAVKPVSESEQALDYGVGDGRHVEYLINSGYKVVGTDVAPASLAVTQKNFKDDAHFKGVFLPESTILPFADKTFSLVVAWEVLHWLGSSENFAKGMREIIRVSRPNASILLTMPTESHCLKKFSLEVGKSTYHCKTQTRMDCVFYSPNLFTLQHLFEKEFGLQILQTLRYEYGSTQTEPSLENRMSFYGMQLKVPA